LIYARIKNLWPRSAEAKYLWLALGVTALALAISLRPCVGEPVIRLVGLVLQLLGIGTVAWGISLTRAFFGLPSFAQQAKELLSRLVSRRRDIGIVLPGVELSMTGGKLRGHQTFGAGANPTVESRLEALEKNITAIHERIRSTQKDMDEEFLKAADALKAEANTREQEDLKVRELLKEYGTSGVHISAIGALWLFVGVILSTAAPELAALLK